MRAALCLAVLCSLAFGGVEAQSPEPPLSETRLTVHTLLREDVFAGFMGNDLVRFSRAERNIEQLMKDRPDQRGNLLAWRGAVGIYRAVRAHEAKDSAEFLKLLQAARSAFAEAAKETSGHEGVPATVGGTLTIFADRLPEPHRTTAWADAYANYALLWANQAARVETLPVHHRGELLAGLVQTAQRTGRTNEMNEHLDRMLTLMQGTPYETSAKQWKADPSSAATTKVTCKACHNPGRLASRLASLPAQR
jgi:hypothetical protein